MTPAKSFFLGVGVMVAVAAVWANEYRVISARRSYDWSSDPPWVSMSIAVAAIVYFLLR